MCAKKVEILKKSLNLPPGHWQLFNYGRLTEVPTVKQAIWIWGFFRKVIRDAHGVVVDWHDETEQHPIPIGEMVAWEIGSIFDAHTLRVGKPQPIDRRIALIQTQVAFTKDNCKLLARDIRGEGGKLAFANPRIPISNEDAHGYLLRVERPGDIPLLIPCSTVLQSFWGRSSNLLHMLLDSRFLDFGTYVVNISRSELSADGRARLWLRQWSLDSDARFLATLLWSQNAERDGNSIERGQDIALKLQASLRPDGFSQRERCIAALPPHSQPMDLELMGMPIRTSVGPFFYVQRIVKCSYRPAFNHLTFDRDNDGRPTGAASPDSAAGGNQGGSRKPIARPRSGRPPASGKSEFELSSDHPGYQQTAGTTDLGRFDPIFQGIADIPAEKLSQIDTKYESVETQELAQFQRWDKLSTLPGKAPNTKGVLGTVIASGRLLIDPADTSTLAVGAPLGALLEQVMNAAPFNKSDLLPEGIHQLNVQAVFPWPASAVTNGCWVFSLPSELHEYCWAWLYSDPEQKQRKRAMCLRITFFDEHDCVMGHGYMVEVEGRMTKARSSKTNSLPKNSPVLFIWRADQSTESISDSTLQDLIIELIQESSNSAVKRAAELGVICISRRHSKTGLEFSRLLADLYAQVK